MIAGKEKDYVGIEFTDSGTGKTCFAVGADDPDSLIQDARKRHALLEITIQETRHKSQF